MKAFRVFLQLLFFACVIAETSFIYNGFHNVTLSLYGASYIKPDGILSVISNSPKNIGHVFYPSPLQLKLSNPSSPTVSFSTTFVFSISPMYPKIGGHGLAFILSSTKDLQDCLPNQYLGLPNDASIAKSSTCLLAVEFDVVRNIELNDINDNHVGIDVNSLTSNVSVPATFFSGSGSNKTHSIDLKSGAPVTAWIEYSSKEELINVAISPFGIPKPERPLISFPLDLSSVINEYMYVGFSSSTGLLFAAHDVLGWSFRINGRADDLDPSKLPSLVKAKVVVRHSRKGLAIGLILVSFSLVLLMISGAIRVVRWPKHEDDLLEDWEIEYGAYRFEYSELLKATCEFGEKNLIGRGGFGCVYKGVIPSTGLEVAIKKVAHDSRQGKKEFLAEIISMGRLRHRNLVQLHGWCRRNNELLLIYDYVPNGSLDKLLFHSPKEILTWDQRFKILIGAGQALLYLHEECDQRVLHRDVKSSNVLIDADLNAKLGDFGLSRIYDHGINPQTTYVVGTLGYLAPELTRTGKATTSTDVYSYGAFMLEVACGRRPIEPEKNEQELVLVDWVSELHSQRDILRAIDPLLDFYNPEEAELVLSLGLLCSHPLPHCRPNMRKVVQFLLRDASLPSLPPDLHLELSGLVSESLDAYFNFSDPLGHRMNYSDSISTSVLSLDKNDVGQASRVTF
ncbi:L-type lectin-domain containing receptor kinase IV.2-like [Macadamia integrifolia]|uniref:L-type lectin-domain containing receptor kinase IV.2-like n=1 Tax=Macadamia integrifolia TaxID=60698 RepID=UPI001C4F71EB|nr:L-type lectin-domain containing receptor kinase IV.2-like [Macadamia integrifolia]